MNYRISSKHTRVVLISFHSPLVGLTWACVIMAYFLWSKDNFFMPGLARHTLKPINTQDTRKHRLFQAYQKHR